MTTELSAANGSFFEEQFTTDRPAGPIGLPIILQLWHIALRWKWVILAIVLASLAVGVVVTLLATPLYTAKSRIEISRQEKNVTKVEGVEQVSSRFDEEFYQTQYQLLTARSLAERIVQQLGLAGSDSFFNAQSGDSAPPIRPRALTLKQRQDREKAATGLLLKNVKVSPIARSSLVDIQYTSADPEWAAKIANAWSINFIAASMDRRFESSADARKFLEGRLAGLRGRLEQAERSLVSYAMQKNIVTLSESQEVDGQTRSERTLASDDLTSLNRELALATAAKIAAESKFSAQRGRNVSTAVLTSSAIASLRQRRAEVAGEYAKLLIQYEPGYPAARALQQQMSSLDGSIRAEEGRIQGGLQADYNEAVNRERDLKSRVGSLVQRLNTQNSDSIQYNLYQRDVDTTRELYNALLQRFKEIDVAGIGTNNISIIDTAQVSRSPSSPNMPINLAISLLAGFALAGAAVFALEQIAEGVRDPGQIQRSLGIPLLGTIPRFEAENIFDELNNAKSHIAEAYLSIRTDLALATDHGVPRSLMLTSAQPAEGKSTSSMSLAVAIARTGRKVLLVDADMRSPSVHSVLGLRNIRGVSNYLSGEEDIEAMLQISQVPGVTVLSAGPTPPSAAELLSSDRLETLVSRMVEQFDHVIIDSPPILGLADAPLISRAVEAAVFVVQAGGVSVRGLSNALDRLRRSGTRIAGAILTKFEADNTGYGYGYLYGYGYGSTEEK